MAICPRGHQSIADDFCDACGRPIAADGGYPTGGQEAGYSSGQVEQCPVCRTRRDGQARYCEACGHEFGTTPAVPGYSPHAVETIGEGYDYSGSSPQAVQPVQPVYEYPESHPSRPAPTEPGYDPVVPGQQNPYATAPEHAPVDPRYADHGYTDPGYDYGGGTVVGPGPVVVPPPPHSSPQPQHQQQYVWTVQVTADAGYFDRVVSQGGPDAHAMRFPPYHEAWEVALRGDQVRVGRRRVGETSSGGPEIDLSGPPSDPGISHLHVVLMRAPEGSWSVVDPGSTNGTTMNGETRAIEVNIPVDLHDGDRIHVGAWTTLQIHLKVM